MLTLTHKTAATSRTFAAAFIEHNSSTKELKAKDQDGVTIDVMTTGTVFVMNERGQTVATYRLHQPQDDTEDFSRPTITADRPFAVE